MGGGGWGSEVCWGGGAVRGTGGWGQRGRGYLRGMAHPQLTV